MQGSRFANRREAEKSYLSFLPQSLKGGDNLVQHHTRAERIGTACRSDGVMKVEYVDALSTEPLKAALKGLTDSDVGLRG
jgi:hypothetical protein